VGWQVMPCSQLIALAMLAGVHSAYAHGIAGNRFFPGTLSFDDPAVADEAILPNFASFCSARSFVKVRSVVANAKGGLISFSMFQNDVFPLARSSGPPSI
jgi:hypothetical protein